MSKFSPKVEILPTAQRRLWEEFVEMPSTFVLYGGTAIALHLGHRASIDFDFFGKEAFDPDSLQQVLPFLHDAEVLQKAPNTLTCLVERGGPVQISFFGLPEIQPIEQPLIAPGNQVKVASLIDLAGMKAAVVQKRAEAKDYLDIHAMIDRGVVDLPGALAAARQIYGRSFNPQITLKALSYFEDGNLKTLPQKVRDELAAAVQKVDLDRLPVLQRTQERSSIERGEEEP